LIRVRNFEDFTRRQRRYDTARDRLETSLDRPVAKSNAQPCGSGAVAATFVERRVGMRLDLRKQLSIVVLLDPSR
jgi:hypothetical protein